MDDQIIAFTEDRAAEFVGVGLPTLRRWASEGLVGATASHTFGPRNRVRLYGFRDLVALMVLKQLQELGISHQHLRKLIVGRLRSEYDHPLSQLTFAVDGGQIFFQHPTGEWEGDRRPNQTVAKVVLALEEIRTTIRDEAQSRRGEDRGQVGKRRRVLGSKRVFAGTRIPVDTVVEYMREGVDDAEILEAFPRLSADDLAIAREELAAC